MTSYHDLKAFGVIYLITNLMNNKRYVGQTTKNPLIYYRHRHLRSAERNGSHPLHRAIRKHGTENFSFEIIFVAFDKSSLDLSEMDLIQTYDCIFPNGYNFKKGGTDTTWHPVSRKKLSKSRSEKFLDPEFKKKHSIAVRAAMATSESKAIRSDTTRRAMNDPIIKVRHKAGIDKPESKMKHALGIAASLKRPGFLSARNAAISAASLRGGHRTPEAHERHSAAVRGRRWITDGSSMKRLKSGEILPKGWKFGFLKKAKP